MDLAAAKLAPARTSKRASISPVRTGDECRCGRADCDVERASAHLPLAWQIANATCRRAPAIHSRLQARAPTPEPAMLFSLAGLALAATLAATEVKAGPGSLCDAR